VLLKFKATASNGPEALTVLVVHFAARVAQATVLHAVATVSNRLVIIALLASTARLVRFLVCATPNQLFNEQFQANVTSREAVLRLLVDDRLLVNDRRGADERSRRSGRVAKRIRRDHRDFVRDAGLEIAQRARGLVALRLDVRLAVCAR